MSTVSRERDLPAAVMNALSFSGAAVVETAVVGVEVEARAALGRRDATRVDMIVDGAGEPWVLEVNVSPGMTETSLLPMGAGALAMPRRAV